MRPSLSQHRFNFPTKAPSEDARAQTRATLALDLAVSDKALRVPAWPVTRANAVHTLEAMVVPAVRHNNTLTDNRGNTYALGEVFVRGAVGTVRLAKRFDPAVSQLFALKEINIGSAPEGVDPLEKVRERFEGQRRLSKDTRRLPVRGEGSWDQEILLQLLLRSPIAPHVVLRTNDRLFIVMPPMDGDMIDAVELTSQHFPQRIELLVHSFATQVAAQLALYHAKDVVHLDIKLDNTLYRGDSLVISDFGNAQVGHMTDRIVGTPGCMAPEIFTQLQYDGRKADVFALGASMLHALVGDAPFESANLNVLMATKGVFRDTFQFYGKQFFMPYTHWYRKYEAAQARGDTNNVSFGFPGLDDYFSSVKTLFPRLFPAIMHAVSPFAERRPSAEAFAALLQQPETRLNTKDERALKGLWKGIARESRSQEPLNAASKKQQKAPLLRPASVAAGEASKNS